MSLYSWELRKWIRCDPADLKKLKPHVEFFINLAEKARREGLLSLEDDIPGYQDTMLREGLQLIVDGTDPEYVRSIIEKRILLGCSKGLDLRRELITLEGILAIQSGDNPRIMRVLLSSFLAPDHIESCSVLQENSPDGDGADNRFVIEEKGPLSGYTSLLENLSSFDDRTIQCILREVDTGILSAALKGAGSKVVKSILRNMGSRGGEMLLEDMENFSAADETEIRDCQILICQTIDRLRENGEIVIPMDDLDL